MCNCTWALLLDQETEQSVYVFSTHLHDPMGAAADEVRALQTQYLLEKAAQVMQAHPEASSLIMGDFNARPDNDPASASKNCYNKDLETQINAAGYQDARVATEYGAKGSVHGFGKYSAILDYLFVSADFQIEDFSVLDEKINGDIYMRVLVLGGSTASVQAGHQVTLCTPYYALGKDAAGSWAVHSKAGWKAWRQQLGCAMTFGDHETGRTQNYSQWRMCDSAHAGYQRLDQGTLNDPGKDSLSKEIQRCLHDPHGRSFHPAGRLRLLPAQDAPRYAPVPLRALLPREIDNMLVCGKALSMDQDALNYARMAPDVMCVGYLAGRVAGMCVKQQCAAQALPLTPLQEEMRRAGAIVPVAPVPVQDTALRIACGDERGFAQAVLTNDAAALAALPPFEQAGALSNRLLADKTRLWFGDISGAQRCTETLEQLCERLRGYAYIDRQGKDGVVRAGLVGPLDDYWLAIQLCVLAVQGSLRARAACHPRLSAGYEH